MIVTKDKRSFPNYKVAFGLLSADPDLWRFLLERQTIDCEGSPWNLFVIGFIPTNKPIVWLVTQLYFLLIKHAHPTFALTKGYRSKRQL